MKRNRGKCQRDTCIRAASVGRFCRPHHQAAKARGEVGFVPAETVREHIAKLRDLGWNFDTIAKTAGTSPHALRDAYHRKLTYCRRYTANPILAIPLVPAATHAACDATGYRRRVRALQALGWRYEDICERSGVTMSALAATMSGSRETTFMSAAAIAKAYEQMCMHRGPSKHTASWAANRGFPPPFAWDEDTIDAPDAEPNFGESRKVVGVPQDELVFLRDGGWSPARIAQRFGMTEPQVRDRLRKAAA